jgi:Lipopolysaccharide kinase (Kdo/WaaP) family
MLARRQQLMDSGRRKREIKVNGWRVEPIGVWSAAPPTMAEDAAALVVEAIEDAEGSLYHRSRHAVTYLTRIGEETGDALEVYVKTYEAPRGTAALKRMVRGGRAEHVLRVTAALHQAGFSTPPLLLSGVHDASGRTMLSSARADGSSLIDLIADGSSPEHKRALLRALGSEVARLHRAGFVHGDLTPHNIFVVHSEPARFIFLDHDRTRTAFPAGRRYRQLRNLVQLGRFDLPGLSNADRLRVLRAYAGPGRAHWRSLARRVARMLARRRRRDAS